MSRCRLVGLTALLLSAAACGTAEQPEPPQAAPPKETVFDDLTATKDKARQNTEQALQQSKERNEKAIEQGESGRAP